MTAAGIGHGVAILAGNRILRAGRRDIRGRGEMSGAEPIRALRGA